MLQRLKNKMVLCKDTFSLNEIKTFFLSVLVLFLTTWLSCFGAHLFASCQPGSYLLAEALAPCEDGSLLTYTRQSPWEGEMVARFQPPTKVVIPHF